MGSKTKLFFCLVLISILLIGCAGQNAAPVAEEAAPVVEESAASVEEEVTEPAVVVVLTVGESEYSMEQLQSMETHKAEATKKDGSTVEYTGVLVVDLLADAGLEGDTVVFIASDGYEVEASAGELDPCGDCIIAFDGDELRVVMPGFPSNLQVKGIVALDLK